MLKIEVIEFEAQDVITASTAASDDFVDFALYVTQTFARDDNDIPTDQ